MTYEYKRYMRDGTVAILVGSRTEKQVRKGKTARDRARKRP